MATVLNSAIGHFSVQSPSLSIPTPTAGNMLIFHYGSENTGTISVSGWTLRSVVTNSTAGVKAGMFTRVASGSESSVQLSHASGTPETIIAYAELDPNKLDTYKSRGQGSGTTSSPGVFNMNFFLAAPYAPAQGGVGFLFHKNTGTFSAGTTSGWGSTITIDSQVSSGTVSGVLVDYDAGGLATGGNIVNIAHSNYGASYVYQAPAIDGPSAPPPSGGQEILTLRSQGY